VILEGNTIEWPVFFETLSRVAQIFSKGHELIGEKVRPMFANKFKKYRTANELNPSGAVSKMPFNRSNRVAGNVVRCHDKDFLYRYRITCFRDGGIQ
jgi:hypothetical protein